MSLLSNHLTEDRPWGSFEQFTLNESSTVKLLQVAAGMRFSLQTHAERSEFWKVMSGNGTAQVGDDERPVHEGEVIDIPAGTAHRLTGGPHGITVLEISLGTFKEDDIHRLEDDFNRP